MTHLVDHYFHGLRWSLLSRMLFSALALTATWLSTASLPAVATAKEQAVEFLAKLEDRGYGEVSIDYLEYLKKRGKLPDDLAASWDLQMAKAWRMAIDEAFNPTEAEERTAKAKTYLDKYLKAHPDAPAVAEELGAWGEMSFKRGQRLLGQARLAKDAEQKAKLTLEARAMLEEALPKMQQSADFYSKQLETLRYAAEGDKKPKRGAIPTPKQKAAQAAVAEAELLLLDAKFKLAQRGFFVAQTYADTTVDTEKATRKEALETTAKQFDEIYQQYRDSIVGMRAHVWEGKCREELGDAGLAQEIYEEVLVMMPAANDREKTDAAQLSMFAQVQYFSLSITLKNGGLKEFMPVAQEFLKAREQEVWKRTDGWQGISLEVAKGILAEAEKAPADQKAKLTREATALLKDMKKYRSEHQLESMALLRGLQKVAATDGKAKNFGEAIGLGEGAAEENNWAGAVDFYEQALAFAEKLVPKERKKSVDEAQKRLDDAKLHLAVTLSTAGKLEETLKITGELAKENPTSPLAPKAGALAVQTALRLYAATKDADEKTAALERMIKIADYVIKNWSDKPEADDARIALAQANLVRGESEEALKAFEKVNPRSERFGLAMYLDGQTHYRLYAQKKQAAKSQDELEALETELAAAIASLEKSVAAQSKGVEAGKPLPEGLADAQLLLAEINLIANHPEKAAELLQPMIDAIKAEQPKGLDRKMISVFTAGVKANMAAGDLAKGGDVANALIDLGEDSPQINGVLATFARTLGMEYKKATAAQIEAKQESDPQRIEQTEKQLEGIKKLLGGLVEKLGSRQNHSPRDMIFLADLAMEVGQNDLASQLYKAILEKASDKEGDFAKNIGNGVTRVRAQLVDLLGQKGQFEEGIKQVNALIDEQPKALEPRMTKGRILQAWANKDPQKLPEAIAQWTSVRQMLQHTSKKPPEYYQVNFNAAECLFRESQDPKAPSPEKALQAQQLLNALLFTTPKLDGPDTVAKYKDLLKRIEKTQPKASGAAATKK